MKDEIKEILDFLKDKDDYIEEYGYEYKRISLEDTKILLDYITNLQDKVEWYENIEINKTIDKFRLEHNKEIKRLNEEKEDYKSRIEKANELLQNILVVRDWEHKGKFRPVKNTSKQDVCKTIVMLNELFETPYRTNYGLLQGVGKDE